MFRRAIVVGCGLLLCAASWAASREEIVASFETRDDLAAWEISAAGTNLVAEGATHGKQALECTFDPQGRWSAVGLTWTRPKRDWSAFDVLVIDVTNPGDKPMRGGCLIGDEAWDRNSTYWNRHNRGAVFPPGTSKWIIPVHGLWRGEAGSRNNDIKTDIDPTRITRLTLSFGGRGETGRVIIDHIRFVKTDRPEGLWAFDFGPESQNVMPGWTGVSNAARFDAARGFGWTGVIPDGSARDTTFGTMLTQDFVQCAGNVFRLAVPPGRYEVAVIFENGGYWGGEQSRHTVRTIVANGREAWSERRPHGAATALYQFEDVEPVGVDLWQTFMLGHIIRPERFEVEADRRGLELAFDADAPWSSKLAAMVVHKSGDAAAKAWVDSQMKALEEEFRSKAVPLDPPAPAFVVPAAWQGRPLVAWPLRIEDEIHPAAVPPKDAPSPGALRLTAAAVRGEYEPLCVAVRPTRDLKGCRVELEWPAGKPSLPHIVHRVRYNTSRGFGTIAWNVRPFDLREFDTVDLAGDVTREFIITVKVPEAAAPGAYDARLRLRDAAGADLLVVPVSVEVHDVALERETDFLMGFFGLEPNRTLVGDRYDECLEQTLALLREHGMNALTRAPAMELTGWKDGTPQIDFKDCDRVYALYRKHGFTKGVGNYGRMLVGVHSGYEKGAEGAKVERESGLPYAEALLKVWGVIDEHARANDWPLIYYTLCDETRVRDRAERELEFMTMMREVSKRYPATVRTLGSYSVNWDARPDDPNDMNYWHQRFFETLDVSSLNSHSEAVMAEAKRLGRDIHIYNQGRDRWSFGLYQWSEFVKGVKARWQWHLNVLHGYQFFDLDGREPDPAMIVYTSKGIRPTIAFERCREGAEDFYLYQTLARRIEANVKAGRKVEETKQADAWLRAAADAVKLNQRRPPDGYDPYAIKKAIVDQIRSIR